MKQLINIWLFFLFPFLLFGQEGKGKIEFLEVDYSSLSKIILIDHYNDNYERTWGRIYEIEILSGSISLSQTEEYYKSFQFNPDSINYNRMELLQEKEVDSSMTVRMLAEINKANERKIKFQHRRDPLVWGTSKILDNWKGKKHIKYIEKPEIDTLLTQINATHTSPLGYLKLNGIDSTWLSNNSERLYDTWFVANSKSKVYIQTFVKDVLADFEKFKGMYFSYLLQRNMSTYPYFEIQLVSKSSDTIRIYSEGQNLFQIPWNINGNYKSYNPNLAIEIAKLLPDEEYFSGKSRLNPSWNDVEEGIVRQIDFKSIFIDRKKWRKIAKLNKMKYSRK